MNIAELCNMEQQVKDAVDELKRSCVAAVAKAPALLGVTQLLPSCCTVNLSAVRSGSLTFSPEYFLQSSQAELVRQRLAAAAYSSQIVERISEMCQDGRVRINGVNHPLNASTIAALRAFLA